MNRRTFIALVGGSVHGLRCMPHCLHGNRAGLRITSAGWNFNTNLRYSRAGPRALSDLHRTASRGACLVRSPKQRRCRTSEDVEQVHSKSVIVLLADARLSV